MKLVCIYNLQFIDASSHNKTIFHLIFFAFILFNLVGCIRSEVLYYVVTLVVVSVPRRIQDVFVNTPETLQL